LSSGHCQVSICRLIRTTPPDPYLRNVFLKQGLVPVAVPAATGK
jgi:hypothetical protein